MRRATCLTLVAALCVTASRVPTAAAAASPPPTGAAGKPQLTSRFLQQVSDLGLWSGTIACAEDNAEPYAAAFGMANHELGVPLRPELKMPIGSNTKTFTAIAIYQLQEEGKLNISDPAAKYIDMAAFGLPNPWCPRLNTSAPDGPCEEVTLDQMLSHTSGMWDSASCMLNPDKVPDYQLPFCFANRNVNYTFIMHEVAGLTPALWELANWTVTVPLYSKPGEVYAYSNNGYYMLGYIVEKVSGMPLTQYYQERIFTPAGLSNTFYDPSMGGAGFHPNTVWNGGYITLLNLSASEDNTTVKVARKTLAAPTPTVLESGHSMPFYTGAISLTASAGGVVSNALDSLDAYLTLFSQPDRVGLSEGAWEEFKQPRAEIFGPIWYNHGVQSTQNLTGGGKAYFHTGVVLNYRSLFVLRQQEDGNSTACAVIGNTIAAVEFANNQTRALFEERCKQAPGLDELLAGMEREEPTPVANMTEAERQAALLPHLCEVMLGPYMQASNDYIRKAIEVKIWKLNEW